MSKSEKAFRNISEVSEWLATPTHVLRFWESKFSQIKPIKRAGGRRYYRPKDMLIIGGIKQLLHIEGHTIKGAQRLLKSKELLTLTGGVVDSAACDDASYLVSIQTILDSVSKRLASVKSQLHSRGQITASNMRRSKS